VRGYGPEGVALIDLFDACRRKRNVIDYMNSSIATETEADELVHKANEFHKLVENWLTATHPTLVG
jgi:hypothetical protein